MATGRRPSGGRSPQLAGDWDIADPDADVAERAVCQLVLGGQRREVAEAARWLDPQDRRMLSLWWLEAAGRLTRGELAEALGVRPTHAAVKLQRMRAG